MLDARSTWLAAGIAPKTVNHRVRALRHLYRLLDGSKASTPADDLERLKEPDANPQFVTVQQIRRVESRLTDPKTRARFMVLVATGMRPAQLRRAVRTDVNLRRRLWMVRPAKGGNPIPMALTRDMAAAWKAFIAADAWGKFDGSDYARALYAAGWPQKWTNVNGAKRRRNTTRPYNAKHTVALTLANSDAEWEDIKDFFGHTDVKTTRIYTGMVLGRLKGTAAKLEGRLGWK
jgi:site-specific recombinase XerD